MSTSAEWLTYQDRLHPSDSHLLVTADVIELQEGPSVHLLDAHVAVKADTIEVQEGTGVSTQDAHLAAKADTIEVQEGPSVSTQDAHVVVVADTIEIGLDTPVYVFGGQLRTATATDTLPGGIPLYYSHSVTHDGSDLLLTTTEI